ncbi:MAG TPA: hypothetical protein VIN59_06945 [Alphaproteobacteria bacterium]
MNDLTDITYRVLFIAMLAFLVGMAMPALAQDPGNVGGPDAPTSLEGRGAIAPLPVPDNGPVTETSIDTTPGDEVRTLPEGGSDATEAADDTAQTTAEADAITPKTPEKPEKPWWRFW